ncbi:hypothetical protein KFU94_56810 [Chloroflexi bacterium TSY]|nr:hypothetical protein [Chloroflexi bacterium TSY]
MALRHPHISNSQWFVDIAGKHIDEAAKSLPPEVVAAAQEGGRVRELNTTVQELAAMLKQDEAHGQANPNQKTDRSVIDLSVF